MSRMDPGTTSVAGASVSTARGVTGTTKRKTAYTLPNDGLFGRNAPHPEGPKHQLASEPVSRLRSVSQPKRVVGVPEGKSSYAGASGVLIRAMKGKRK